MRKVTLLLCIAVFVSANDLYYYKNGVKELLYPLSSVTRASNKIDYYENEKGNRLGVSNKIIIKMTNSTNLQSYLLDYSLTLEKSLGDNLYLLQTEDKTKTIDLANKLHEKVDVEYAHPDFFKKRILR